MRLKNSDLARFLEARGIRPSPQRLAVARYILYAKEHPTAHKVWTKVRKALPRISRATVYNTLNLLVSKELLRRYAVGGSGVVFDANVHDHHHFIEEDSGRVHDLPWGCVAVSGVDNLRDFEVGEYHVVMRGRRVMSGRLPRKTR
ncbi:MAG: Fur family transcriptional regulator [Candidatus Binataceae bacterium]